MHATKRDPHNQLALLAVAHLVSAQDARIRYDTLLQHAIATHGDTHMVIAGVYAEHFPETTKNRLRFYARMIGEQSTHALRTWVASGRHVSTLLPLMQQYRKLSDGRVSYY